MQTKRVFGLDALRAAAILCVIISHAPYEHAAGLFKEAAFFMGVFGVELFFVLSGFLIGNILLRSLETHWSFSDVKVFWIRRWFRTVPNYLLFFAINSVIGISDSQAGDWRYLVFLQNFAWPHPTFFAEAWSLAIEEWFYLLLPAILLCLVFLTKNIRASFALSVIGILLSVTAGRYLYITFGHPSWDEEVRKVVILRLDSLMFGVVGAYVKRRWDSLWVTQKWPACVIGIIGLTGTMLLFFYSSESDLMQRTLMLSINSFSILCFLPVFDGWLREPTSIIGPFVTRISLWSYSMYLCHVPLCKLLFETGGGLFDGGRGWNLTGVAAWVLFTVVSSKLVYENFEKKMTALRQQFS